MADKENTPENIPKKLSFTNSTNECRSRTISIIDFHTSLSSVVPIVDIVDTDDNNDQDLPLFSNRQIYKNLVILSLAILLIYIAFYGIVSLQSSLNVNGNVGVNSLIVINVFILFGSLFLTGIAMDIFGLKWTIIIGGFAYIFYVCANVRPIPILMYIAGASVGIVSSPFWTSQATYISRIARYHAHYKQKNVDNTISLFFGIFFAIFGTSNIWGNLISYFVLNQTNNPQKFNCGIYFDPILQNGTAKPNEVSESTRYVLCGIYAGIGIIAMVLLLALDQIRLAKPQPVKQSLKKSVEVVRSLFRIKNIHQLFLVPITMWTMVENGFLQAQFTRAFITCLVGIRFIGLIMTCAGICNAIFSYVFGSLVKHIGRGGCFIIAAVLNYGSIILMYFWEPVDDQIYILYIIAGIWGIADAVWQSQVVAVYTVLYGETDSSAIAKYRLWKAVGSLLNYSYASYASMQVTLFILFAFLTLSMICYGIIEIHIRWKIHHTKKATININDS